VAARSEAGTVFARSNTGVVGSNSTRGMDVSVRLFCVCVVLWVGSGLATGWSPVQGVGRLCIGLRNWKCCQDPKGSRAIESEREERKTSDKIVKDRDGSSAWTRWSVSIRIHGMWPRRDCARPVSALMWHGHQESRDGVRDKFQASSSITCPLLLSNRRLGGRAKSGFRF
jgi:hypothetical protein